MTVSTYIIGFLLFLAEYFLWQAIRTIFTGAQDVIPESPNFRKAYRAAVKERLPGISDPVWLLLRRLRPRMAVAFKRPERRKIHT